MGQVNAGFIRLYEKQDFNGAVQDNLPIDATCHNLDQEISSAVTYGACIHFYYEKDCTGRGTTREPEDGFYFSDVSGILDEGVKSYIGCISQNSYDDEIELFEGDDQSGESEIIKGSDSECHDLDNTRNKVSSVQTHESCVELFQGPKCEGVSIKLHPGSPVPRSLAGVKYPGSEELVDNNARSVKRCSVSLKELVPPPSGSVIKVFPDPNLEGEPTTIDLEPEGSCKDLEGKRPVSLHTAGNCVQLFANADCTGSSLKVFPGAQFPHERIGLRALTPGREKATSAKSLKKCPMP